ncbi:MAG: MotA/TolQ/ExbB proton channel family protein [Thiotrichaceae bacterium]|nr:MotA/TolQ/ExbB proton channel family protein [Thiotrichaceae bacterium]
MSTPYINNSNNTLNDTTNHYPIEQPFKFPLIITALLVLLPALALFWFFGDSSSVPRSLKLFFGNWISPIILWFFTASFLHLYLKKGRLRKEQQQSNLLNSQLLNTIISDASSDPDKNELHNALQQSSEQNGINTDNLARSRLSLFLNHDNDDVDETFAIKEREYLKGSFSLPRFMVWAIPILGFIGTVWGISNGIAHFSDAMTSTNSVTDVSSMLKENLPLVTNSLATAFDTTLLALLLSIPLMMFMLTLEKEEEAYLIDLDERWFHDIKPMLQQQSLSEGGTVLANQIGASSNSNESANTKVVANEIKLLSTQIKALQETMEDLYETVFTSKLGKK